MQHILSGREGEPVRTQEQQPTQPAEGAPTPTPVPLTNNFLSLVVTPQDAVTMNYLLFSGAQLTLVLRATDDNTRVQTEAVTLQYLLTQYNIPVPVKLPYSFQPRIDGVLPPSLESQPEPTPGP